MFFVDNILVILGKIILADIPLIYNKRPIWIVVCELVSVIPVESMYNHESILGEYSNLLLLKDVLKLPRIFFYFICRRDAIGENQAVILFLFLYFVSSSLMLLGFLAVDMILTCTESKCTIDEMKQFISLASSISTSIHFASYPNRVDVFIYAIIGSTISYYFISAATVSQFVNVYRARLHHKFVYQYKVFRIKYKLDNVVHTPPLIKAQVLNFYDMFWKMRNGYAADNSFAILPFALRQEIAVDANWYAFKHSKVFRNSDLPFLRAISIEFRQRFLFPGDFLYRKNDPKTSMVYIISGMLQVLSEEDHESSLITLTAGTCFGELNLVMPCSTSVAVICKEYCRFQVLDMRDFIRVARKFPTDASKIKKSILDGLGKAKLLHTITDLAVQQHGDDENKKITLMWIKSTLHRLMVNKTTSSHESQNVYLRKEFSPEKFTQMHFYANNLDLLTIPEADRPASDTVFMRLSFPWILKPDTIVTRTWDILMCITIALACIIIPFFAFIDPHTALWYSTFVRFVTVIYWLDLFVSATIAVATTYEYLDKFFKILPYRMLQINFWVDVIAAYPLENHAHTVFRKISSQKLACLNINRLLKMWRIRKIFNRYLTKHGNQSIIVSYIKFFILYTYISYFAGCIMYGMNCFDNVCHFEVEGINTFQKMMWFLSDAAQIVTTAGLLSRYSNQNFFFYMYMFLIYVAIFLYVAMVVDICCIHIFQRYPIIKLQEAYTDILAVVRAHGVQEINVKRIESFIRTEWKENHGENYVFLSGLMIELPERCYATIKEHAIGDFIKDVPLFVNLPEDMIYPICLNSKVITFPPGEVLSYSGIIDDSFYCIMHGYCEIISPLTKMREKIIGPKNVVYLLEACLNCPRINTVITTTYCRVIRFNVSKVLRTFTTYPEYLEGFRNVIETEDFKESLKSLYNRGSQNMLYELGHDEEVQNSFCKFGYNLPKDSLEEYEYYVPFDNLEALSFFRILLLRITIMPSGRFLFFWEAFRSIFALISSVFFVINPIGTCKSCRLVYLLYFLDITAYLDIYVRFHVCYYNKNGIVVTHPLKTAINYVKNGFLLDFIAVFPVHFFLPNRDAFQNKLLTLLHCNRVLQLRRYFGLNMVMESIFMRPKKLIVILKYFNFILVISNLIAALQSNLDCDFHIDIKGDGIFDDGVSCSKASWYTNSNFSKPYSPVLVHVLSLYFVTTAITDAGMQGFVSVKIFYTIFQTIIALLGYIFSVHVIAMIMSSCSSRNITQMEHSHSMKILLKFMKKNKVPLVFRQEAIKHYEMKWKRQRGKDLHELIKKFQLEIQQDVLYEVYSHVLEKDCVFTKDAKSFYRSILTESVHETLAAGSNIALVNDIKSTMHIIIKGLVDVVAPDGTNLTILNVGSMFGNLDNYSRVRQTVAYKARCHIEILTINSVKFHEVLQHFPQLNTTFKVLTAMHIDYLHGRKITEPAIINLETSPYHPTQSNVILSNTSGFILNPLSIGMRAWKIFVLVFSCLFNNFVGSYVGRLQIDSLTIVILLYTSDVVFIMDIFMRYRTAYENDIGIMVTDIKQIRKKVHKDKFNTILSYLSVVPLDILIWIFAFNNKYRKVIYAALVSNRYLRAAHVHQFIVDAKKKINVHILLIDSIHLLFWALYIYHILTCITIDIGCTVSINTNPPMDCDSLNDGSQSERAILYVSTLFKIVLCLHRCGQDLFYPVSMVMLIWFIALMAFSVIYTASVLTYLYGTARMITYSHGVYERKYFNICRSLVQRRTSLTLTNRIDLYLKLLWKQYRGTAFPEFLRDAPTCLREKIVNVCFQHHLSKNAIFQNCHEDFLRQVMPFIRIRAFFSGDYIIYQGSVNDCMYFIHEGEIFVISEDAKHNETVIGKLTNGQAFGVIQGLNEDTPHRYTFKSLGNSTILVLIKKRWQYLLDYFPASKDEIYKAANEYNGF